jgi:NAD(P)-dependent dehydrogenase (short-subunit alcohol dehydrogenase family)
MNAMNNKTVVITGGNDGIGLATATALAKMGARVILLCRNQEKAEKAVASIQASTGNQQIEYVSIDLLSFASVRKAAEELHQRTAVIDVLINNAGGTFSKFELAEDGLEKTLTNNHFSHFLLTGLVIDLIKKSTQGRIVNVSSHSHYDFGVKMNEESLTKSKGYFIMKQYSLSKLANVMFTMELADRLKAAGIHHVTVNALHPGTVKTRIGAKDVMGGFHKFMWLFLSKLTGISLEEGARTSVYLASSPDVSQVSGLYFSSCSRMNRQWKETKPMTVSKEALDNAEGRTLLWAFSEKHCGIQYP